MPFRSMSPLTVERTSVSVTLRAAAMLARPAVRHDGECVQHELDRRRAVVLADEHRRVVGVEDERSLVRPLFADAEEVGDRRAAVRAVDPRCGRGTGTGRPAGICFTASRVANSVAVSTPLRLAGWFRWWSWWCSFVVVPVCPAVCWLERCVLTQRPVPAGGRAASIVGLRSMALPSCRLQLDEAVERREVASSQVISKIARSMRSRSAW